jgi:hypothetical protein
MKKETRVVDSKKKIMQITTTDERWYEIDGNFLPSVTWICEYYPKGIAFYKWLANKGWDESQALMVAAGDKGSKVHQAIALLIEGKTIKIDAMLLNPTTGQEEELTPEEYEAILSFAEWVKSNKVKFLDHDFIVVNAKEGYAGTVDLLCEIDDVRYLIDIKTSPNLWPSHELQVNAYRAALPLNEQLRTKIAILQIGYNRNKAKYKLTEIEEKFSEFLATKTIWANETKGIVPLQKDYPLEISL